GTCDKVTGECFDCQHDTYGPHCEFCNAGFYGNATTGSPYSCLPCACPHPTRGNNFAESCQVSETGSMLSCECKTGYTGERCDRCDAGWFGEPLRLGGFCSPCSCNDNNDLTIPGACHPITGHCDKCQAHTTGTKCEVCTAWYHGDAVAAKNCTECKCDQCGSSYCDHQTGGCSCHPLVEGPNCDHCVANTWGFSSCRGCEQCNCAQASVSPQCNMETGQCACMRGATGVQCEQCEHGFWDYGPQGCRKCDCEADLSMGTVCDVHTGHCQCQEGATGPRCDTCIKDYLRIPTFGCRYCDECVHSLNADLDTFGHSVMEAKDILSNVSTAALTGARLKRITVAVDGLKPEAEKLLSLSSEIGMDNLKGDVAMLKASVSDIIIKGNRSLAEIEATLTKANGILDETEQTARDAVDRVDTAQGIVEILRTLVKSIGQNSGATGNRVTLVKDAEQLLESIRSTNFDDADNAVKAAMEDAQAVLGKTATFQERRETLLNRTKRIADESLSIANRSQDYRNFITKVMQQVAEAKTSIKQMSPFALLALVAGLDSNEVAAQAHLNEANELLGDAQALLNSIAGVNEQLTNQLADFNSTSTRMTDELPSYQSQFAELKQIPMQCNARVAELQHEASRLSGIFGGTRLEAENAMTAANAYSEIGETIAAARETSAALVEADLPSEEEGAGESKATTEESASLHRRAAEARKVVVNNLTSSLDGAHKAIKAVLDTVVSGKKRVETVKVDMAALGESGLLSARLEKASETSAEASDKLDTVHQFVESLLPSLENIANLTSATVTVAARRSQDLKGARTQTNQTKSVVPSAIEALERLQLAAANASAAMDDVIHQISLLRKKIALARDMANRIKVGARFEKGSSLQLYNPERVTRSAAYTKIRFFFRTNSTDGLLLYFGNEVGASGTRAVPTDDYIAIELVQGQPKLVVDLGGAPLTITADTFAADGKWRRITVERTGKATSLSVDAENEQTVKSQGVVPGSKSVLNLHQEFSKLYVGGVPGHARMPNTLRSRNFVGDIEQLTFHDDPVGLWNVVEGGTINVQGADQRNDMRTTTSANGISLNGEGFAVMNLGSWNPRKQTEFMISFRTYAREGLIMYIGKERDFMSLELNDGRPVLQFDCGSGRAKLTSEKGPYNDGKWHMVHVHRVERHAKLTVDEDDTVEADAPGTLFELSVTDVFYIGGVPSGVDTKTRIRPFHGCIEKVQLEGYYVNLNEARSSKGVEPGCVDTSVRVITFDVGGGWSQFTDQPITGDIELTLRFKTEKTSGLLAYLADAEKKSVFSVYLDDGFIVVESNGEGKDKDKLKTELSSASDGDWHFVTASRTAQQLRVEIDDLYSREVDRNVMDETVADLKAALRFGNRADEEEDFVGCIGDVTLNGRFLDFANAESSPTVQLTGCALAEFVPTVDPTSATTRPRSPTDLPVVTPTTFVPAPTRNPGECALRRQPYGAREDSVGFRFGLHTGSRLEYDRLPEAFDKSGVFSLQFRATASSGVLFFATNEKHTDHLALYLKDGKVVFSYNSGSGTAILESKRPYIDGEWHTVRVEREGTAGKMTVDDAEEVHGESPKGTDAVDTQPPFYVGGLPTDLVPFATRVIPGSRPEFGGCMRDFKLNDVKFQPPSNEVGVVPCSQFEEDGLFFRGTNNSHAVLDSELVIGSSFSLEMELKPRVKTGVIVSISANDLDYLSLQLIDGSVKFALDNGGGAQTLVHKPTAVNALCDGHWHNIKIYKTKNLMTMTVDGKSGMKVIKKADSTETNTKDPLYLGGVPEGYLTRGLETREPYAGCVRVVSLGTKPRIKKNISLANVTIVGDVAHSCPIN
uniref:Uncharacterized protein n=1 Tax=Plectus sambesii TaxID=2011161 RepID=A0A914WZ73_9BILA